MSSAELLLQSIVDTARKLRDLQEDWSALEPDSLYPALESAGRKALTLLADDDAEATLQLTQVALLLASGPVGEPFASQRIDLLIDILDAEAPAARLAAGETLQVLAEDRFKEVALGVERALSRLAPTAPALIELPYLLVDFTDAGAAKLISKFLQQPEAEVVACAIEALAEIGDPTAISALRKLESDSRRVVIDDEDEQVTLGELASEAIEELSAEG